MEFFDNLIDVIFLSDIMSKWVPVAITLMVLSFLYRDNPLYKVAEKTYLAVAIGYGWVRIYNLVLVDYLFRPIEDMFIDFQTGDLFNIGCLCVGFTLLARFSKKKAWVANYYYGALYGYIAGLMIPISMLNLMTQANNLMRNIDGGSFYETTKWLVLILGTFCGLMYFFFSKPHKGFLGYSSRFGIVILMIFFGATFGYTIMGRVALFIDRAILLVDHPLESLVIGGIIIVFILIYFKFFYKDKEFDDGEFI